MNKKELKKKLKETELEWFTEVTILKSRIEGLQRENIALSEEIVNLTKELDTWRMVASEKAVTASINSVNQLVGMVTSFLGAKK